MATINHTASVNPSVRTAPYRRIAVYIAAVLGLGWLGPVIDQVDIVKESVRQDLRKS